MPQLVIRLDNRRADFSCALCHQDAHEDAGLQLALAENLAAVCRECGNRHAPFLTALLHLADVAERVGHINRHTPYLPLEALLKLACAAEAYTFTPERGPR